MVVVHETQRQLVGELRLERSCSCSCFQEPAGCWLPSHLRRASSVEVVGARDYAEQGRDGTTRWLTVGARSAGVHSRTVGGATWYWNAEIFARRLVSDRSVVENTVEELELEMAWSHCCCCWCMVRTAPKERKSSQLLLVEGDAVVDGTFLVLSNGYCGASLLC